MSKAIKSYLPIKPGCPNFASSFFTRNVLDRLGLNTPDARKFLYLGPCVLTRFGLYTLVYKFCDRNWMIYIVTAISAIILIIQFATNDIDSPQWWSASFVFGMTLVIFISCLLVLLKKIKSRWIPLLLYGSLIGGMVQSLRTDFC